MLGGFVDSVEMWNLWVFLCTFGCLISSSGVLANVVLTGNSVTLSFPDIAANFARPVNGSGEHGTLFLASPLDACSPLAKANSSIEDGINPPYVLIIRGGCHFADKVQRAQDAGFKAAIIYNNQDTNLVAMAGNSAGIHIHAVFVSEKTGLKLRKYVGRTEIQVWLMQNNENSAWSIMAISFLSLLALSVLLATCFFVRKHPIRRGPRASRVREFNGMSRQLVKAMPSLIFTTALEDNCTSATCAICLEDYRVGDKLRILPCSHKFHSFCVDSWLTSWRTFCPVCKHDARTSIGDPPASERTPLLSSTPASVASSSSLSSTPMQISHLSPPVSYVHSISIAPDNQQSFQGCHESRHPSSSQTPLDASSSSHRSRASHFISSNTFTCPSLSPLSSIYMSFYASPSNVSSSYIRSSSQQPHSLC